MAATNNRIEHRWTETVMGFGAAAWAVCVVILDVFGILDLSRLGAGFRQCLEALDEDEVCS